MKLTLTLVILAAALAVPAQAATHSTSSAARAHYWRHQKAHAAYVVYCYQHRYCKAYLSSDDPSLRSWARRYYRHEQFHLRRATRMVARLEAAARPAIPHLSAWLCIHHYEGSWTDGGDPYWGGLQMDRGFMGTYGADMERRFGGFANVWPAWAQMVVAERAWRSRGFHPWPNTARYCGLPL